jgi:hypothetical protein
MRNPYRPCRAAVVSIALMAAFLATSARAQDPSKYRDWSGRFKRP